MVARCRMPGSGVSRQLHNMGWYGAQAYLPARDEAVADLGECKCGTRARDDEVAVEDKLEAAPVGVCASLLKPPLLY